MNICELAHPIGAVAVNRSLQAIILVACSALLGGCASMDLMRFAPVTPSVSDDYSFRVSIVGSRSQRHIPFIYMRTVERSPYIVKLAIVLKDPSLTEACLQEMTFALEGETYHSSINRQFQVQTRTYSSSGSGGVRNTAVREGRCEIDFPSNIPITVGAKYTGVFRVNLQPENRSIELKCEFSLNQHIQKSNILKTYSNI